MKEYVFTVDVDSLGKQVLSGIPLDAWLAFVEQSKVHFPDAGEDAPFMFISEIIVAALTHESFVLTGIPPETSKAMDAIVNQVNWTLDQWFVYNLRSAAKGQFRMVSFTEPGTPQEFGTITITGVKQSTFDKIEKMAGVPVESFFGILINGIENGEMEVSPNGILKEIYEKNVTGRR